MNNSLYVIAIILLSFLSCKNQYVKRNIDNSIFIQNIKKKVISKTFHKNGKISEISFDCDSIINLKNEKISCSSITYSFYSNGNLKEKGCQGIYNGYGIPVGTWYFYDKKNKLKSTTYYHNDQYGKDFILVNYFVNDKLVKTEKYNNYILYENEKKLLETY